MTDEWFKTNFDPKESSIYSQANQTMTNIISKQNNRSR